MQKQNEFLERFKSELIKVRGELEDAGDDADRTEE